MNKILTLTALSFLAQTTHAEIDVVYGRDNRQDIYQVTSSLHKKLAKSTAGMIHLGHFEKGSSASLFNLTQTKTLEESANVCSSESFSQQTTAANCSGFLVGPDLLVTAGHCYKSFSTPEQVCNNFAWVFDYELKTAKADPTKNIPLSNIYLCKSVVAAELTATLDYAIIKLDRKVVGRESLKIRTSGKIADSTDLVVIGHPNGLPTKVSASAKITRNLEKTRFSTNLDTFHGNSGSAVFDAKTGLVEGILIQGKNDYVPSKASSAKGCMVVNKCDDNGNNCESGKDSGPIQWGEVVLRTDTFSAKLSKLLEAK